MKTTREDLERTYDKPDPWGYRTNPADLYRKSLILSEVERIGPISALDVGCGEGFITEGLLQDCRRVFGFEASKQAKSRWHVFIGDWDGNRRVEMSLLTGVLYENYEWQNMIRIANNASRYLLTCNIADREYEPAIDLIKESGWKSRKIMEFPYDRGIPGEDFMQRLRIFER